jgi:hypothetical protein
MNSQPINADTLVQSARDTRVEDNVLQQVIDILSEMSCFIQEIRQLNLG